MKVEQKLKLDSDFDKKFRAAIDKIQATQKSNSVDTMDLVQQLLTETRRQIKQAFELGKKAGSAGGGNS